MLLMGIGAFFTVTVILAIAGIPAVLFGIWMWFFSKKQVAAIEEGYAQYVASLSGDGVRAGSSAFGADARTGAPLR